MNQDPYSLVASETSPDRVRLVVDVDLPFDVARALLASIHMAAKTNPPQDG